MAIQTRDMPSEHPTDAPAPARVRGVIELTAAQIRLQRRITLLVTVLPFVAAVYAVTSLWGAGISGLDLTLFLSFYLATGLEDVDATPDPEERLEKVAWPLEDLDGAIDQCADAKSLIGLMLFKELRSG